MKLRPVYVVVLLGCAVLISAFIGTTKTDKKVRLADTSVGFKIDTLVTNVIVPWQITFLPDSSMLFTERAGRVRIYRNKKLLPKPALTISDVALDKKTGLLGMCLHPAFAQNKWIYVASNYTDNNRIRVRVARYAFRNDSLVNPFTIIKDIPGNQNHTGCRLVFGPDKKLYITTGDADQPILAQDLKALNGKILRVNDDGTIPADNPFAKNDTARKEIWSYGHRNPQGLVFEPTTGVLFDSEHGPTGGDEINIIKPGQNYGWPLIHHQDKREGMTSPLLEYTPSIGPSEAMFYHGNAFPELKGILLVACLRGESILRIKLDNDKPVAQEVLLKKQYGRIRSLVTGPDGYLYISTSHHDPPEGKGEPPYDMILRLRPSKEKTKQQAQSIAINKKITVQKQTAAVMFQQLCAACHGNHLQGTEKTKSLLGRNFSHGANKAAIINNITNGIIAKGMPSWRGAISKKDIAKIADYVWVKSKQKPSK
ncbi:glucose/arabinose dehydrogenase [Mucilaginibacter oryzae]|uniref:Glucose/arabinose dehydrogenase n=1 Tax=Mucilaginibacter oryzae TaxID=468058 RepID=A0A316H626_9SPHI|nr:PQQ-dependent sugar dehydrogenase [Mucilaginibacter oryzae]PWK75361.1 glucose/arabinose dehydrogenase [Mucilaginibacter oryzae]